MSVYGDNWIVVTRGINNTFNEIFVQFLYHQQTVMYPYDLIENMIVTVNDEKIFFMTGKMMWAYLRTVSKKLLKNMMFLAKQGIACLSYFVPISLQSVNKYSKIKIIVNTVHQREQNNEMSKKSLQMRFITNEPFRVVHQVIESHNYFFPLDLSKLISSYIHHKSINIYNLPQPHITNDKFWKYYQNIPHITYFEFPQNRDIILRGVTDHVVNVAWLIENPLKPGTFFAPSDYPLKFVTFQCSNTLIKSGRHHDFYILDKLVQGIDIPQNIAYYTLTLQTNKRYCLGESLYDECDPKKYFLGQKGEEGKDEREDEKDEFKKISHVVSHLNISRADFTVNMKLNSHIPKNAKICLWVTTMQNLNDIQSLSSYI